MGASESGGGEAGPEKKLAAAKEELERVKAELKAEQGARVGTGLALAQAQHKLDQERAEKQKLWYVILHTHSLSFTNAYASSLSLSAPPAFFS